MLQRGLSPLFPCQKVIYGGDTVGGRGLLIRDPPPCHRLREDIVSYK